MRERRENLAPLGAVSCLLSVVVPWTVGQEMERWTQQAGGTADHKATHFTYNINFTVETIR